MRLHVLSFPHSELTRDWSWCAFTDRTRVFADMMAKRGYEVIAYGGENHDLKYAEHCSLVTREEQQEWWPDYIPKKHVFNDFDPGSLGWMAYTARARKAIDKLSQPGDVLCLTMGTVHRPIAQMFPELFHVETGIGYSGVYAPHRIYESRAWMNYLVGKYGPDDGAKFYHTVIPLAYEADDFWQGYGDGGYYAFVGRLIAAKGPQIAALAAARAGIPLVFAGQGAAKVERGRITCEDGTVLEGDVTYVGVLGPDERTALMACATACFTPTTYFEPFGGVSVECQLTGTPAIVSDWGGLPENVIHGETGFICRTLAEFTGATSRARSLDRSAIRERALGKWSTDVLGYEFQSYFNHLDGLRRGGFLA